MGLFEGVRMTACCRRDELSAKAWTGGPASYIAFLALLPVWCCFSYFPNKSVHPWCELPRDAPFPYLSRFSVAVSAQEQVVRAFFCRAKRPPVAFSRHRVLHQENSRQQSYLLQCGQAAVRFRQFELLKMTLTLVRRHFGRSSQQLPEMTPNVRQAKQTRPNDSLWKE